jgi:hypothetical protein
LVPGPSARRVFRRRRASIAGESRNDPRSRGNSPRLRAAELCSVRFMIFKPSRPSIGSCARRRGVEPPRFNQIETRPPGQWGNACRRTAPAPQSKPVTHASRLVAPVAPSVAFGPGLRIPAAGPAYVDCTPFGACLWTRPKSLFGLVRRHRLIRRQRLELGRQELARREMPERDRDTRRPHAGRIDSHMRYAPAPPAAPIAVVVSLANTANRPAQCALVRAEP